MTPEQLVRCDVTQSRSQVWAPVLTEAAVRFRIETSQQQAHWLAQILHESARLTTFAENLNYSVEGLLKTFGRRLTPQLASKLGRIDGKQRADQVGIANTVYANRHGNGRPESGDGWRYRGQGPIQLTFKDNYRDAANDLNLNLLENPGQLAKEPLSGALVAAWYWSKRGLNFQADVGNVIAITVAINGGYRGLDERIALTEQCLQALA
jgi:putative chitinase